MSVNLEQQIKTQRTFIKRRLPGSQMTLVFDFPACLFHFDYSDFLISTPPGISKLEVKREGD